jgi:hypothetical protein
MILICTERKGELLNVKGGISAARAIAMVQPAVMNSSAETSDQVDVRYRAMPIATA